MSRTPGDQFIGHCGQSIAQCDRARGFARLVYDAADGCAPRSVMSTSLD
jgi:hypothetical protein